ncbi:MAG TPA: hypothetical protein V6C76_06565 [Drouetiella sp.]
MKALQPRTNKNVSRCLRTIVCILCCLIVQPWYLAAMADTLSCAEAGSSPTRIAAVGAPSIPTPIAAVGASSLPTSIAALGSPSDSVNTDAISPASTVSVSNGLTADAAQTADVLDVRQLSERVIRLRQDSKTDIEKRQLNDERALLLRRIFEAVLQLQSAESQLEFEISFTYDAIAREQRRENTVNQIFNAANFAQSGTFGIIGPVADLNNHFVVESTTGVVSTGIGTVLPIIGMIYNKRAKASHLTPPEIMSPYLNGKPVDASRMPPLVVRYLNSSKPGESRTRMEVLNASWKERFKSDMTKKETLFGIDDGKKRSLGYLHNRLTLQWSLYTSIQEFDSDLLSLLNQVRRFTRTEYPLTITKLGTSDAEDAARLLHVEHLLTELTESNATGIEDEHKRGLQLTLLETVLAGCLEMAVASDKCQKELNYQYDIVLAELTDRQSNFMQKLYEVNFIQGGAIGSVAGLLFLKKKINPATELLLVSSGIGLGLTAASFVALHGGWRKNQTGPNSLADFFNLRAEHGFTPLVYAYLNSASPRRADGKTRRECLMEYWNNNKVVTADLRNKRILEKLASMPSCKWDTINLVLNRTALLSTLQEQYNEFDGELLDLLRKGWPVTLARSQSQDQSNNSLGATASLLGVQGIVIANQQMDEKSKLLVTRQVLDGFLSVTADANVISQEVDLEFKVLDRLNRQRDKVVQLTNNINFLQAGTLGLIGGSLGLAGTDADVLATNRISIVSSAVGSGLALASMLEQHGGWRPDRAKPNALGAVFGKEYEHRFSPTTIRYLNAIPTDSKSNLSRRQVLIKYWKTAKIVDMNVGKESVIEKLCVAGSAHHWWSETIRLINNRITMLFDLKGVMRSSNVAFAELLKTLD